MPTVWSLIEWCASQLHLGATDCRFVKTLHAAYIFKVGLFFFLINFPLTVLGVNFKMSLYTHLCST